MLGSSGEDNIIAALREVYVSGQDSGKRVEAKCKAGRQRRMKRWTAGRRRTMG